jgi:hypothetical protein
MCTIQDITKLQITYTPPVNILPLVVGIGFILLAIGWSVAPSLFVPLTWTAMFRVRRCGEGLATSFAHAVVEIRFGRIQELTGRGHSWLVALPANDYFDDQCIQDSRSSLGAFVNDKFPNEVHKVCGLTQAQLAPPGQQGAHGAGPATRYDKGKTLYFEGPLGKDIRMAFVATTTVVQGEGIRCEAEDVFAAVKGVHRLMNEQRLDNVAIPLLGCGHGGLRPHVSLLCMLVAFAERLSAPSGHHIKSVRIVVFQRDKMSRPTITRWQTRRLLAFVKRYCESKR